MFRSLLVSLVSLVIAASSAAGRPDAGVPPGGSTRSALDTALERERRDIAFYEAVLDAHGPQVPFTVVLRARQRHEMTLLAQYRRLGFEVPENQWIGREVAVPDGPAEACDAAAVAEYRNAAMYDELAAGVDEESLRGVCRLLGRASRDRHLPKFREHGSGWASVTREGLTPAQAGQLERAEQAREAMFGALLSRLAATLRDEGAPAAIEVCARAAPKIAAEISAEHGVRIGRTSWKLRNPANRPPVWADLLLDERPAKRQLLADRSGRLGVLSPIRLNAACLQCHGKRDEMTPEVRERLEKLYPDDRATGFADGDLRGWFWVEVKQ